ncbi:MAG: ATP-binding cassette domain-containing protein [Oscillospiraceae bacterium]|nr:ATP-binding cassette domain-containing protein [Oscillospiraceae bacterium]
MPIKVSGLGKTYGVRKVVDDLSFEVSRGRAFGILGRNGAGKTTTIRMLLGVIAKDSGSVEYEGSEIRMGSVKVGYLPEERGLYPKASVIDQLVYFGELRGMGRHEAVTSADGWLARMNMAEYRQKKAETLSKGNQQKIQIIQAFVHSPEIVVLDEPFSGLDPVNSDELKGVFMEFLAKGKYIIFSSHQMSHVEDFCNDIMMIKEGRSVLCGDLYGIKKSYGLRRAIYRSDGDCLPLLAGLGVAGVDSSKVGEYRFALESEGQGRRLMSELVRADPLMVGFEMCAPSLHEIFVETEGES